MGCREYGLGRHIAVMPSKQNPQQFPAGGSVVSAKLRSEVALSAEQHGQGVLVLQLIRSEWLHKPSRRLDEDSAVVLLVHLVQQKSAVKAKALTGVQTVLKPTTPTLKSGLQTPGPPSRPQPKVVPDSAADAGDPQSVVLARSPYCN